MSLVATATARLLTTTVQLLRVAVNRLGVTPFILVAAATAVAIFTLRPRPPAPPPRRRRRRGTSDGGGAATNDDGGGDGGDTSLHDQLTGLQSRTNTTRSATTTGSSGGGSVLRKPQWLSRAHRVSIGAVCSREHQFHLFALQPPRDGSSEAGAATTSSSPSSSGDGKKPMHTTLKPASGEQNEAEKGEDPVVVIAPQALPYLRAFARLFELFIVVRVDDDATQRAVVAALEREGVFESGLDRRKIVFCETDLGRVSVARQLESYLHSDESFDVVQSLQRFLHSVAFVSPDARALPADIFGRNVARLASYDAFFS